jgi:FkbM family methyltransferase
MLRRLRKPDKPRSAEVVEDVFGVRFVVEPWEHAVKEKLVSRSSSIAEFAALSRLLQVGGVAFDVGAFDGLHSVMFGRWVGSAGRVFAFEPVSHSFWRMKTTLALNRCANVSPFEMALLDTPGVRQMNVFDPEFADLNTFGAPTYPGEAAPVGTVEVRVGTVDEFCNDRGIPRIDLLKLDVEGFERAAVAGADEMLRHGKIGAVSFEISQIPLEGSGVRSRDVFDALADHGYLTYRFDPGREAFEGPLEDSDAFYENLYASRTDLARL